MLNIGILGCSEIAFRRFMPEAVQIDNIKVKAVAEEYDKTKLDPFCKEYNLEGEESFDNLIAREDLDAIYVPQPPALHHKWAKKALESGKHVLIEKPSTISFEQSSELVEIARNKNVALHENYMFQYHSQISAIKKMLQDGIIGDVRLMRANFGFPLRAQNDFRYNKALGGGALLDAGGYAVKLATIMLGDTIKLDSSSLSGMEGYEVDMFGSASLSNEDGVVCQIGFGMDCYYQCCLEIWGSKGRLYTNRIFTAPPQYEPIVTIDTAVGTQEIKLEKDAHFKHSIEEFYEETLNMDKRNKMYDDILRQSRLIDAIRNQ